MTFLPHERHARYEALVLPHLDRLLGFAARRTLELGDAEDAVQEMCMRAWVAFDDLLEPSSVRPWLFRILRTVLSDAFERRSRRQRLIPMSRLEDVHEDLVAGEHDVVFAEVTARLDAEMLQAALDAIPEDFAVSVELHDIEGFKYHEIADVLGIPMGTVMSRISRGRRMLAGVITEHRHRWALGVSASGRHELPRDSARGHGNGAPRGSRE